MNVISPCPLQRLQYPSGMITTCNKICQCSFVFMTTSTVSSMLTLGHVPPAKHSCTLLEYSSQNCLVSLQCKRAILQSLFAQYSIPAIFHWLLLQLSQISHHSDLQPSSVLLSINSVDFTQPMLK